MKEAKCLSTTDCAKLSSKAPSSRGAACKIVGSVKALLGDDTNVMDIQTIKFARLVHACVYYAFRDIFSCVSCCAVKYSCVKYVCIAEFVERFVTL